MQSIFPLSLEVADSDSVVIGTMSPPDRAEYDAVMMKRSAIFLRLQRIPVENIAEKIFLSRKKCNFGENFSNGDSK
jgi:hypothetical protein